MADTDDDASAPAKGGGRKKLLLVLPLLLLLAGGGWFFLLRGGDQAAKGPPPPVPGEVLKLDPISINLAGGHYLKLGIALQAEASAHEVDGSKALDLAISEFSGRSMSELATPAGREQAKAEYVAKIRHAYLPHDVLAELGGGHGSEPGQPDGAASASGHGGQKGDTPAEPVITVNPEVYDVYFTEFVMQ